MRRKFEVLNPRYLLLAKYIFSVVISLLTFLSTRTIGFTVITLIELGIIFVVSNQLLRFNKIAGQVVNSILILLFNIQVLVLMYSTTFVTLIMLDNIASWQALKGRLLTYILGLILLLLFSFLPITYVELQPSKDYKLYKINIVAILLLSILFVVDFVSISLYSTENSPSLATFTLLQEKIKYEELKAESKKESKEAKKKFKQESIENFVKKPADLAKKPNVILIFTEGMSQHIIDDSRNITPNIRELQSKSLRFENYYNHTFATYRGIIGQLYSGFQLENFDQNHLISLQSILKEEGYQTSFLNTEPNNPDFTNYLKGMDFDRVINPKSSRRDMDISDKDAYRELFEELENSSAEPFFISMYTFGTHIGMDSSDKKFEDGSDRLLNRFYNLDYHFGSFIEKFNKSKISDNTILVFTTDHATYVDDEFRKAFPDYGRGAGNLDKVPLFFYYKGIEKQAINAQGRNSVELTPTILDYLDITKENYFLGNSLFAPIDSSNRFETLFNSEVTYFKTNDSRIDIFKDEEIDEFRGILSEYFSAARYP